MLGKRIRSLSVRIVMRVIVRRAERGVVRGKGTRVLLMLGFLFGKMSERGVGPISYFNTLL